MARVTRHADSTQVHRETVTVITHRRPARALDGGGTAPDWTQPETERTHAVKVELDLTGIVEQIATKAAYSKTGRATHYGGLIKAKRQGK